MKQVLLLPFPFKTGAGARRLVVEGKLRQKHLSRSVLGKRFSESMQQIYRRTPMSKCDFNKVAKYAANLQENTLVEVRFQ